MKVHCSSSTNVSSSTSLTSSHSDSSKTSSTISVSSNDSDRQRPSKCDRQRSSRYVERRDLSQLLKFSTNIIPTVPRFCGKEDIDYYIETATVYANQFPHLSDKQKTQALRTGITGEARELILGYPDKSVSTVKRLFKVLLSTFKKKIHEIDNLHQLKQGKDEKSRVYAARVRRYVKKLAGKSSKRRLNKICLGFFKAGLRSDLRDRIHPSDLRAPKSFRRAIKASVAAEAEKPKLQKKKESTINTMLSKYENKILGLIDKKMQSVQMQQPAQTNNSQTNLTKPVPRRTSKCFHCERPGHRYMTCFKASEADKLKIRDRIQLERQQQNQKIPLNSVAVSFQPPKSQQ